MGEKKFLVFLYEVCARSAMAQNKILRAITLATFLGSLSLGHTHTHTHQRADTHSHCSHAACPLQQAPTSKPSPFSVVTSRVAMVTPAPPQSGAELTCLTAQDLQQTVQKPISADWGQHVHFWRVCTHTKNKKNTLALLRGALQSVVFKGQSQPPPSSTVSPNME